MKKMTREEYEELATYEPSKMSSYELYERRFEEEERQRIARSMTLAQIDEAVKTRMYK